MDTLTVKEEESGTRLDKYLANIYSSFSREFVKKLIEEEKVLVNDKPEKASYKVSNGDTIFVDDFEIENLDVEPENIPLDIVYEDSDIIVINKRQGMVVHPASGVYKGTLVNALLYHCKDLSSINGVKRPGIVHRIDKDTSGLIVVAKNDKSHLALSEQLKDKTMNREYYALVHGVISEKSGRIDAPIGRDIKSRIKMAVVKDGKDAITHFEVIERFKEYTLIKCKLETGRTHQIRVHMAYIHHPIAADPVYGPKATLRGNGQYLHAYKLTLVHPTTKKVMTFEAPLPDYYVECLNKLRG